MTETKKEDIIYGTLRMLGVRTMNKGVDTVVAFVKYYSHNPGDFARMPLTSYLKLVPLRKTQTADYTIFCRQLWYLVRTTTFDTNSELYQKIFTQNPWNLSPKSFLYSFCEYMKKILNEEIYYEP